MELSSTGGDEMSITTDKSVYGWNSWEALSKNAEDRACDDSYTSDDVGILWAKDRTNQLEAQVAELRTLAQEVVDEHRHGIDTTWKSLDPVSDALAVGLEVKGD